MFNLLILFFLPFVTSFIAFFLFFMSGKKFKVLTFILSLLPLIMLIYGNLEWIGSEVRYNWLSPLSIEFYLKVDALSLLFLFLTAFVIPVSILAVNCEQLSSPNIFYGLVLFLQGLLIGFFTARDLAIFTIFWESMLLPLYFIINLWGGQERQRAAIKFLIYMIGGSALMVAAVLGLYFNAITLLGAGSFDMEVLSKIAGAASYAMPIALIFLLAFAVKTPLFPFHAWLPDAYYQASIPGTILLSAILSKAGIYGILRIGLGFFPEIMQQLSPILLGLAIAGVLYGALAAWSQQDYKRLIAYSSFSHVNFILVGLFVFSDVAHEGAILQALNHGITIAALFLVAGWLQERLLSTNMNAGSGLAKYMPTLCWVTLFFVLSSVALPGLNNFVGELLILYGLFGVHPWLTAFLGVSIILSVIYMLRWMQKMYFGPPSPFQSSWTDITAVHLSIALPIAALILCLGIYPTPVLKLIEPAVQKSTSVALMEKHS